MNKKNIIYLLFLVIILSGCSVHKEDDVKRKVAEKDISFQMNSFLYDENAHVIF